ncbi:hypothetical protein IC007_0991 [Sulfuracidifex tepidarius]|uniref:Uncharacterized protein n=1 Tax=Sulfuracidifex tepidarius TaxID=1294262 RepID=A0A510E334_9CREN|nr:hypothetical protein IC007_0991 [Sulfuracidifex tepidarius]
MKGKSPSSSTGNRGKETTNKKEVIFKGENGSGETHVAKNET